MDYFFEQMRGLLGPRYTDFVAAYDGKPRHKALRVNTVKVRTDEFAELSPGAILGRNELCKSSFYTAVKPSLDPLYHAGLYYMQESSASAAVEALSPFIGRRVLDLCAAPGGKSTQAAAAMSGGVIFCNDVESKRVSALEENIARLGILNAVTTCASAKAYRCAGFDGYFDTLIVDAPCSGGGMMRYENVEYGKNIVDGCAARQREILDDAVELLVEGGYMLYSTCTFAPEENETNVRYIIDKGFEPVDIPLRPGEERGIGLPQARRIYPHNFDGEGHFYCVLRRVSGGAECAIEHVRLKTRKLNVLGLDLETATVDGVPAIVEFDLPRSELKYRTVGVNVFERGEKNRVSYAFLHAADKALLKAVPSVELDSEAAMRYIRGEQIDTSSPRGDAAVTYRGYALGAGRCAPDGAGTMTIKNLYPKHLRINR